MGYFKGTGRGAAGARGTTRHIANARGAKS